MRIFGLEINWSPKQAVDNVTWHRLPAHAKRLGDMTPAELRGELADAHAHVRTPGGIIGSDMEDPFQRIFFRSQLMRHNSTKPKSRDVVYLRNKKMGRVP